MRFPDGRRALSTAGQLGASILVGHPQFPFMNELLSQLRVGNLEAPLWDFDYNELLAAFHVAGEQLEMPWVTPYLLRHAGPSWDALSGARPMLEIQRRGQWKAVSSMARYEKHARVGADEMSFSLLMRGHFQECAAALEGVLLGRVPPPELPR